MALTSISDRKTPSRPTEITFGADLNLPSSAQTLVLIGHRGAGAASGASGISTYSAVTLSSSSESGAAKEEAEEKFGEGSQLALMVEAAVKANELGGGSSFPPIRCIPLASGDAGFGPDAEGLTTLKTIRAEFVASPYDGDDDVLRGALKDAVQTMSGAERSDNSQYGTIGVVANQDIEDPADLDSPDTQYLCCVWFPNTEGDTDSVAVLAAAAAARMAGSVAPFNPMDDSVVGGIDAPTEESEWITVGLGMKSETALDKGWTPLRVMSNGDVAFVRTVVSRITVDGNAEATSYYDVQDFQVLYYYRLAVHTRYSQADFKRVKASADKGKDLKGEVLRLAKLFETNNMFQAVDKLAPQFEVERSATDRHRFDVFVPVNVIPGLHVVATNIQAGTQFDTFTV